MTLMDNDEERFHRIQFNKRFGCVDDLEFKRSFAMFADGAGEVRINTSSSCGSMILPACSQRLYRFSDVDLSVDLVRYPVDYHVDP